MKAQRTITGLLLVAAPILFMGAFTLLQINLDYPDILRRPASDVLEQFAAGGGGLIANWYAMLLSALLFIPIAVLLQPFLAGEGKWYLPLATTLGVLAGLVQALGFARWPFLVPALSAVYTDPIAGQAARESVAIVFMAFNLYAGLAVGEHLGYLFTAGWTVLVGLAMLGTGIFPRWLGWLGMLSSLGILAGLLEPAGVTWAGPLNALAYILWALWLLVTGLFVLKSR